jgi:hypothetical protein
MSIASLGIAMNAALLIPGLGHNGGPPLDPDHVPEWGLDGIGTYFDWKRARQGSRRASRSVALFRLARAERVGLTYEEYLLEILDRGRYLQLEDGARLAEIRAARGPSAPTPQPPVAAPPNAAPETADTGPQAPALRRLRRVRDRRP